MKKILIVGDQKNQVKQAKMIFSYCVDIQVCNSQSITETNELLKNNVYDLIWIARELKNDGDLSVMISNILSHAKEYNCIILGTNKGLKKSLKNSYIPSGLPMNAYLKKAIESFNQDSIVFESEMYKCVPVKFILSLKEVPCNVYIKIESNNEARFIKYLNNETVVNEDLTKRISNNKINHFYIEKKSLDLLTIKAKEVLVFEDFTARELKSVKEVFESINDEIDYANFILNELGIRDFTQELAEKSLSKVQNLIESSNNKDLKALISNLTTDKSNHYIKQISLSCLLCAIYLDKVQTSESKFIEKLIYASIFQNISIKNYPEFITSRNKDILDAPKNRLHPKFSADIIRDFEEIPFGVDKIILEHHGDRSGEIFNPIKKSNEKLSLIFMILNELATQLIIEFETNPNPSFHKMINDMYLKGQRNNEQIFKSLLSILSEDLSLEQDS